MPPLLLPALLRHLLPLLPPLLLPPLLPHLLPLLPPLLLPLLQLLLLPALLRLANRRHQVGTHHLENCK